jgi:hypothetical protein
MIASGLRAIDGDGRMSANPHPAHEIRLRLPEIGKLFNAMDASPLPERDLSDDVEAFLFAWTEELGSGTAVSLVIQLERGPDDAESTRLVEAAVQHYFAYRAERVRIQFAQLMREGRRSLAIGLLFLFSCFVAREFMGALSDGPIASFMQESVVIAGWVAMWRPMEIYLYEWWPLRRRRRILERMSRMPVRLELRPLPAAARPG